MAKEDSSGQEKTEQPTGKRKSKSREEGQVAKSQEINTVAGLTAALIYFALNGGAMLSSIRKQQGHLFTDLMGMEVTQDTAHAMLTDVISGMLGIIMPFLLVLFVAAIMSNVFQFGFMFTLKPLKPRFDKMNPIKGIKRLFSVSKLVNIVKGVAKLAVTGVVPYYIIKGEAHMLPLIMDSNVWHILCYIGIIILKIFFYVILVLLLLAILDFVYTRWKHNRDMMMTKQEVKEELKQQEGDPKVKARIRQIQFDFLRKMMLDEVKKADVVVTNPVHVAVALKYDRASMDAPRVVAKGARLMAEKIKKLARDNNVPVIENRPLAQSLFKLTDVGETIPESLYKAVAEILAYVYSRSTRAAAGGY